ncbi:hypothetical protein ACFQZJ_10175 [Maribacter chungangensis]|uniref:EXPERA domain-containing protein n=1 Tax=Maribacter chungangensis TaxID=1069117 RepID=A0ABW3B3L7_9FLAO
MKEGLSSKRKQAKYRIFIDSAMVFFVVMAPFVFKIHEYLPRNPNETFEVLGFTIGQNQFADVSTYVWFLLGKFIPLYLLFIWFFTCKHWWYHAILIPITMYSFQIFEVVYSDDKYVDSENLLWLLPICMVIIPFVYLVRVKLYDKYVHGIDLEAMDAELEALKSKNAAQTTSDSSTLEKELENLTKESFADELDRKLSTRNLEQAAKQFQLRLQNLLNFNNK